MFIDNDTKLRVNIFAPYKGFSKLDTEELRQRAGVVEIPEPAPPVDYKESLFYRTEQQEYPYVIYTRKSDEQILQTLLGEYETALDNMLDNTAKAHRYNDRFTFALRAGYAGPYQAEGIAFAQWMDACNTQAYTLMNEVAAGTTQPPATIEDFLAIFPPFVIGA